MSDQNLDCATKTTRVLCMHSNESKWRICKIDNSPLQSQRTKQSHGMGLTCGSYETPPWKQVENSPSGLHTALSSSSTCLASSLVGHSTIMLGNLPLLILTLPSLISSALPFSFAICTMRTRAGMPNASVFPVPVRERPMTSRLARTGRMALAWTGVKWVMPLWERTSIMDWGTPQRDQWGLEVERNLGLVKSSSSYRANRWDGKGIWKHMSINVK